MKVTVKGAIRDLLAFRGLTSKRRKRMARSPARRAVTDPVNTLARRLHPERQDLLVVDVRDETRTARTYRLAPDVESGTMELANFRAGQYVSVKADVRGATITRPYSISSAPFEAVGDDGFYELTVRRKDNGYLAEHIWASWGPGTSVVASGPNGLFYHEPIRDGSAIIGVAGGSGITPFRSMAREIVYGQLDVHLTLFYGSSDEDDIIFYDELGRLAADSGQRLKVVHVLSCEEVSLDGCEQGFISADIIRRHADTEHSSLFICGPLALHRYMTGQLTLLEPPPRRVRRGAAGEAGDVLDEPGFPLEMAEKTFRLTVRIGDLTTDIPARAIETVLVAMERANLAPPSQCRSGECGYCRSELESGSVYVRPEADDRREADRSGGFIHPCVAYPLSDLEVRTPRGA